MPTKEKLILLYNILRTQKAALNSLSNENKKKNVSFYIAMFCVFVYL
jgi:hypothetical protein